MAFQAPTCEPSTLIPGTSWSWTKTLVDYPPSEGWTFKYQLTGKSSFGFAAAPDPTNTFWVVSVAPDKSAPLAAGPYRLTGIVTLPATTEMHPAVFGNVTVEPNPLVADGTDQRQFAEIMLGLLETEIQARVKGLGNAVNSYAVDGRSFNKMTLAELRIERNRFSWEVAALYGGGSPEPVSIQFGGVRRGSISGQDWQWNQ